MSSDAPLDLSEIDPPIWRVLIRDVVYGPYTLGQMRSFVLEERITLQSKIACGDGGAFVEAGEEAKLTEIFQQHLKQKREENEAAPANHVVITRTPGEGRHKILIVLNELGQFVEVMPGVFLLNTTCRTAKLRERLGSVAEDGDRLLIVNASDDRLAWLGLGPETDTHIRSVWQPKR